MIVQDIMVSDTVTVSPSASVTTAAATMLQEGTSSLFVSDGDRLLGMITEADILYGVVAQGFSPDRQIWEFMDFDPPLTYPGMDVIELVALMDRFKMTKFPVVEHGRIVGSVTLADIAASLDLA